MNEGIAGKIAKQFINSKITPLLMVASLLVGIIATFMTPREEEPQIVVPMVDIFIPYPAQRPPRLKSGWPSRLSALLPKFRGLIMSIQLLSPILLW